MGVERAQKILHDFVEGCVLDQFELTGEDLAALDAGEIDAFVEDVYVAALDLIEVVGGSA